MPLDDNLLDAIADTIAETEKGFRSALECKDVEIANLFKTLEQIDGWRLDVAKAAQDRQEALQDSLADAMQELHVAQNASADTAAGVMAEARERMQETSVALIASVDHHRTAALLDIERALSAINARVAMLKDGQPGPPGAPGQDAEIIAPDDVAEQIAAATKMLAALPVVPASGSSGISLRMPAIEIPAPVVHVQVPPKKRLRTIVKAHDKNGRITEMEQVEVDE